MADPSLWYLDTERERTIVALEDDEEWEDEEEWEGEDEDEEWDEDWEEGEEEWDDEWEEEWEEDELYEDEEVRPKRAGRDEWQ